MKNLLPTLLYYSYLKNLILCIRGKVGNQNINSIAVRALKSCMISGREVNFSLFQLLYLENRDKANPLPLHTRVPSH